MSPQAPSPVLNGARLRTRCVARSFRLRTRFEHSSFQVLTQPQNTHNTCHECTISQSIKSTMIRQLAVVLPPNKLLFYFTRCSLTVVYRPWSSRTENNLQNFSRPESCYRYHPPKTFRNGRHHDTTAWCGSVPKDPILPLDAV